jgi:hypothetical protein
MNIITECYMHVWKCHNGVNLFVHLMHANEKLSYVSSIFLIQRLNKELSVYNESMYQRTDK